MNVPTFPLSRGTAEAAPLPIEEVIPDLRDNARPVEQVQARLRDLLKDSAVAVSSLGARRDGHYHVG